MSNKRPVRWTLAGLAAVFLVMQIVPVDRSNPPVDPSSALQPPSDVAGLLERACYDCHSNETRWPAYSFVAPSSWFVARHVREGRDELNFSEWASLRQDRKAHKFEEIAELVESHDMPLSSYLWMHEEARLTDEERRALIDWAEREYAALQSP